MKKQLPYILGGLAVLGLGAAMMGEKIVLEGTATGPDGVAKWKITVKKSINTVYAKLPGLEWDELATQGTPAALREVAEQWLLSKGYEPQAPARGG